MANTYTKIYVHIIFAVKGRASLIPQDSEKELYAYIAGVCKNRKHQLMAIGGMSDHIHMLISMSPDESISTLVQNIKINTSKQMHEKWNVPTFTWQSGYGAFSYSQAFIERVEGYINNQKQHHAKKTFDEEWDEILAMANIECKEEYRLKGVDL